jgi:AraC family transcriptional regulator
VKNSGDIVGSDLDMAAVVPWGSRVRVSNRTGIPVIGVDENYFGRVAWLRRFASITLAETHYTTNTVVPSHRPEFPGFFMPLRGAFELVCGSKRTRIWRGRASYHNPEDVRSLRVLSPGASGFSVELREGWAGTFIASPERVTLPGSKIPVIMAQLHRELHVQDEACPLAVQGLVLQATAELTREVRTNVSQPPLWLRQAVRFLADNIGDRIDMKQLADVAGIGSRDLMKGFKRYFNRTPAEYLRCHRIAMARQRLAETREPIARVANEFGFYDQAHFCHEFKKATGCSPTEYRNLVGSRGSGESDERPRRRDVQRTS